MLCLLVKGFMEDRSKEDFFVCAKSVLVMLDEVPCPFRFLEKGSKHCLVAAKEYNIMGLSQSDGLFYVMADARCHRVGPKF